MSRWRLCSTCSRVLVARFSSLREGRGDVGTLRRREEQLSLFFFKISASQPVHPPVHPPVARPPNPLTGAETTALGAAHHVA